MKLGTKLLISNFGRKRGIEIKNAMTSPRKEANSEKRRSKKHTLWKSIIEEYWMSEWVRESDPAKWTPLNHRPLVGIST